MRTLKYAILGLLTQKSMTGYELMQQFESVLTEFWSAKHSQIYPELKKLTEEGLLTYSVEISGTVLEKKVYTITETGHKEFADWLMQDEVMGATPRDVFKLRLFFSGHLDPKVRIELIESQLRQHEERLIHLRVSQQKFALVPKGSEDAFGEYLVLLGAVMREETHCSWLEQCIKLCRDCGSKQE